MNKVLLVGIGSLILATGCENKKTVQPIATTPPPAVEPAPMPPAPPVAPTPSYEGMSSTSNDLMLPPPKAPVAKAAPAPKATAKAAPAPAKGGNKYVIKKGDTLSGIAKARYGKASAYKKILAANPKLDPNKIVAGTTIILP